MKFTKMHGCGNDYIYINCLEGKPDSPSKLAVSVSDRHFGIGSDGLILICPSEKADFRMEMYNADGSAGRMCGNGIRCLGKFVYDNALTGKTLLEIETPAGIKELKLNISGGKVESVRVNMGRPEFCPDKIPVLIPGYVKESIINEVIEAGDKENKYSFIFSAVSMGNPHMVVETDNIKDLKLEKIGPAFEKHRYFPEGVNAEFIEIIDEKNIKMRVWERGSGETLACGTGACAAAVVSFLNGRTRRNVTVHLPGGALETEYAKDGTVYMTGPAVTVCTGEYFCNS